MVIGVRERSPRPRARLVVLYSDLQRSTNRLVTWVCLWRRFFYSNTPAFGLWHLEERNLRVLNLTNS